MEKVRESRHQLVTAGQASPPWVGHEVIAILQELRRSKAIADGLSVLDVGCGLGHQMQLISGALPGLFKRIEGVDWSPATVEKHRSSPDSPYGKVVLCSSDRLPYADGEFDLALSMENLEHLYGERSIAAIVEMMRVAKRLIATTPLPEDCINFTWIHPEITDAILDPVPLSEHDYVCLESAVHKSTVFPSTMIEAGFTHIPKGHGYYVGKSSEIVPSRIRAVGIDQDAVYGSDAGPLKDRYLRLLARSVELHKAIVASPHHRPAPPPAAQAAPEPARRRRRSLFTRLLKGAS